MTDKADKFVVVWRPGEGAAVQTYATDGKEVRVFNDLTLPEVQGEDATREQLEALLASKDEFAPRRVTIGTVRDLLGWDV